MEIIKPDLHDSEEVGNIIDVIFRSFSDTNLKDSTERLIQRMQQLYGPGHDYLTTSAHLKKSSIFYVAKDHGDIIGIIRGTPEKLSNLYILRERQGKGIGKALLHRFEEEAKNMGSHAITLKSSKYALPFYVNSGYSILKDRMLLKKL